MRMSGENVEYVAGSRRGGAFLGGTRDRVGCGGSAVGAEVGIARTEADEFGAMVGGRRLGATASFSSGSPSASSSSSNNGSYESSDFPSESFCGLELRIIDWETAYAEAELGSVSPDVKVAEDISRKAWEGSVGAACEDGRLISSFACDCPAWGPYTGEDVTENGEVRGLTAIAASCEP
jgi:hypothetical protein